MIGEELGVAGILGLLTLYGMIAYAGLRTARRAVDRYAKLVATGITSLILCQALLNIYTVLGLAPLTGVPLPFISSGSTSLILCQATLNVYAVLGLAPLTGVPLPFISSGSTSPPSSAPGRSWPAACAAWPGRCAGSAAPRSCSSSPSPTSARRSSSP